MTARSGLILAGGKSTRFGRDKASVELRGRTLLQWTVAAVEQVCAQLVVVRAEGQVLPPLVVSVPVVEVVDEWSAKGPLAGLATGLSEASGELCVAVSCDAPLVEPALLELLFAHAEGHDIACPYVEGFLQPLVAAYRPATCAPVFRSFVDRDVLKITAAYGPLDLAIVPEAAVRQVDPGLRSFRNANTPAALASIEALLGPDR